MSQLSRWRRCVDWLIAWRWALLAIGLVVAALSLVPSRNLQFDRSLENMFAPDDPILAPYQRLKRTFGADELVLAAYDDPQLLTPDGLERLDHLVQQIEKSPGVTAAISIGNGPLRRAVIDPNNPLARAYLDLLKGYAIGPDGRTAGVICLLEKQSSVQQEETVLALRRIMELNDPPGVVVGEPVMVVDGFRYLEQDGYLLARVSTILLIATIIYCFRSLRWVIVPLAIVQVALMLTNSTLVASGLRLSMVSSMLSAIVTIVAIATTIHLIVRFRALRAEGVEPAKALAISATELGPPIFWALATDAFGFGSLLIAKAAPMHDFGLMMVVGTAMVLVSMLLLLPGLVLIGGAASPARRAWGEGQLDAGLHGLSHWIEHHPTVLGIASAIVALWAAIGCTRLEVETDFTKNFRANSPLVRAYEFVESRLGGAGVWDVIVPAPQEIDYEFLHRVERLEERLRREVTIRNEHGNTAPGLTKVLSLADAVQAATLGAIDDLPLAAARDQMASTALSGMRLQMPRFVAALHGTDPNTGQSWWRILLRAKERQATDQKESLIAHVQAISQEEFPESEVTGSFVLLSNLIDSTLRDQWRTFVLATAGIALMMLAALRSVTLAAVALVPNVLPILVVTGLMGWLGLKINMGAAMIAAVSMGLSIDSSIHYITAYRALRLRGMDVHEALRHVHQSVGRAMVFSTAALVMGFSALCLSEFVPTIYFGALVGLTLLGGLAGNLVVLPLLLAMLPDRLNVPSQRCNE